MSIDLKQEAAHYNACLAWIALNATSAAANGYDACDARAILHDIFDIARDGLALRSGVAPPVTGIAAS